MTRLKGRISSIRDHGKIVFLDLISQGEKTQVMVSQDHTEQYQRVKKELFNGALIEVLVEQDGPRWIGKSLEIKSKKYLFPDQYPKEGIKDIQARYKDRVLDLIVNQDRFLVLKKRFQILQELRVFLKNKGFLQVQIPVLDLYYGGAMANPFVTKALYNDKTYYLRIAHEFPLKKLIMSGFTDIYYLGSVFRNEGLDSSHSFQFDLMEFYTTSYSFEQVISLSEQMYRTLYQGVWKSSVTPNGFDLKNPWPRYDEKDLQRLAEQNNLSVEVLLAPDNAIRVLGSHFHLMNYEKCPLGVDPYRFESYVNGRELVNSYEEQTDFQTLTTLCKQNGYSIEDLSFLQAMKYGMPKTVGFGIGFDRLVQAVLHERTVREVQPFPFY